MPGGMNTVNKLNRMGHNTEQTWREYVSVELAVLEPILARRGIALDDNQPHISGERFLMRNITTTSGTKLILIGTTHTGTPVVIKATRDYAGKAELQHERKCRELLHKINFAYETFSSPEELALFTEHNFLISIQRFIEQSSSFTERSLPEQFSYALTGLKNQESVHATTRNHYQQITRIFGVRTSQSYQDLFDGFSKFLEHNCSSKEVRTVVARARTHFCNNLIRVQQYCGFLTHTDFVPHNFRIADDKLYLLDFSSLTFGNKHEGWARFLNFMTLYNPELEALLIRYVEDNRAPEERESLQLLRIYRLAEIITYYVRTLGSSTGSLHNLNTARIHFWRDVLEAELENTRVDHTIVAAYKKLRDTLRSDEEKMRQKNLH